MKINILNLLFYLLLSASVFSQSTCDKSVDLVKTIQQFHYGAKPVDSAFSALFSDILITKSDAYGLFLSIEDITQLRNTSFSLKKDLDNSNCSFYKEYSKIMNEGINEAKSYIANLNAKSLIFTENDSISIDKGKIYVPQSELKKRWNKWLQYLTVSSIDGDIYNSSQIDSIFQSVLSLEQCRLESYFVDNSLDKQISDWYLTSIANTFDPHTTYFSNDVKDSYYESLSDENLSFGFDLDRNERGQLKVASIIPGGAAWNSNRINEDMILNSVIVNSVKKDFSCIRYQEAMNFLNNNKVESAKFIFETGGNILDTVSLIKTITTVQENIVQSFILKDSSHSVGYIYLPSFYTSENEFGISTNGCAADISREVIRLKKEGIEALIIDLRNNGGGHMLEAINLIGIFIDYGTLGVIDGVDRKPRLIKDMNRGLIYDGPLTVMINEFSASASEFFAVTLQDYKRAIIVGSTSFGKSTAQSVLPIEANRFSTYEEMEFESKDFVKITMSCFYRVNGETYQRQGVVPDIIYPSILDEIEIGEKTFPSAILESKIDKNTYFKTSYSVPVKEIKQKYEARNLNNPYYKIINKVSKINFEYWKKTVYPIGLNSNNKSEKLNDKSYEEYYNYSFDSPYEVNNPSYLSGYSNQLDKEKEINFSVMEDIKEDLKILETYWVTIDLINIINKK